MTKRSMGMWLLTLLLMLFFLVAGREKLRQADHIVENYVTQGLSTEIMFLVGGLEIAGAVGLLWRRYSVYFAMSLTIITALTAISAAIHQVWDATILAVIVLILTALLTSLRWTERTTYINNV